MKTLHYAVETVQAKCFFLSFSKLWQYMQFSLECFIIYTLFSKSALFLLRIIQNSMVLLLLGGFVLLTFSEYFKQFIQPKYCLFIVCM